MVPVILNALLLLLINRFSHVCLCATPPIDVSPPGSRVPGILQARTLEWVAITFSNAWKWKVKVKSLSRVRLLATPRTAAYQARPPMGFSRQEYWSRLPLPSPLNALVSLLFFISYLLTEKPRSNASSSMKPSLMTPSKFVFGDFTVHGDWLTFVEEEI